MTGHLGNVLVLPLLFCFAVSLGGSVLRWRWSLGEDVGHYDQHVVYIGHIGDGVERVIHKIHLCMYVHVRETLSSSMSYSIGTGTQYDHHLGVFSMLKCLLYMIVGTFCMGPSNYITHWPNLVLQLLRSLIPGPMLPDTEMYKEWSND